MPFKLHFIRHGETEWNREVRLQGSSDIPLNETGRLQAERVSELLAAAPIGAVIASDLTRARDTAQAVAAPHGLQVELDSDLRERSFGIIEGVPRTDLELKFGTELQQYWDDPDRTFDEGESRRQVQDRAARFITRLLADPPAAEIALVSHGGTIAALVDWLERAPMRPYRRRLIGNCSVTTVEIGAVDAGDGVPQVLSIDYQEGGEPQPAAR